ncbi:MAG: PPK2 family polyphosphate kinase [Verrucomicrobiota bacterium]
MPAQLVSPDEDIRLKDFDPGSSGKYEDKQDAIKDLEDLREDIRHLCALLRAEEKHKVLIVLQGLDAAGKDGTVRHVFYGVTHFGIRVVPFEKPTKVELAHDYLWRIHKEMPRSGELVVFNRSHYEDVLAVRVRDLKPKSVWRKRFDHINEFEHMLADEGTTILKFFLHISKDEQKERLQARLDEPHKHWKYNPADLDDRAHWDDYMEAFEDVLNKTSHKHAPWYIVPSDRKWYRNLCIAETLIERLKKLKMEWPKLDFDPKSVKID